MQDTRIYTSGTHTNREERTLDQQRVPAHFTKEQFLRSNRYSGAEKDVLSVILQEEETYSLEQIEQQFTQFIMREVQ